MRALLLLPTLLALAACHQAFPFEPSAVAVDGSVLDRRVNDGDLRPMIRRADAWRDVDQRSPDRAIPKRDLEQDPTDHGPAAPDQALASPCQASWSGLWKLMGQSAISPDCYGTCADSSGAYVVECDQLGNCLCGTPSGEKHCKTAPCVELVNTGCCRD